MTDRDYDNLTARATRLAALRWRVEIEILRHWARMPRGGRRIVEESGLLLVDFGDLTDSDTRTIAAALEMAGNPIGEPWSLEKIGAFIRAGLIEAHLWSDENLSSGITGSWGPGPLAALLTEGQPDTAILQRECERLKRVLKLIERIRDRWQRRANRAT